MHECAYHVPVEVEWDVRKADANRRKHGIDFADAATVLHDGLALTAPDDSGGEARFATIGTDALSVEFSLSCMHGADCESD